MFQQVKDLKPLATVRAVAAGRSLVGAKIIGVIRFLHLVAFGGDYIVQVTLLEPYALTAAARITSSPWNSWISRGVWSQVGQYFLEFIYSASLSMVLLVLLRHSLQCSAVISSIHPISEQPTTQPANACATQCTMNGKERGCDENGGSLITINH